MNNFIITGKNITEVINVKEKGNQLFRDKFVLVMLVLGLLTIVAAAGAVSLPFWILTALSLIHI